MNKICKNYQHYLYFSYESVTGDCLSCKCNQLSNDHEFKQYLRMNVQGAKCPNRFCEVTMGRGWVGSHHGGARMTCGDCSGNYNFHPGLSNDGNAVFNHVTSGRSNITQNDKNILAEKIKMYEQKRCEEEEQRRKDDIQRKENQIRIAVRQAEIDYANDKSRENANLIKYNNQLSEFTKFVNNLINNPDSIMTGIKETPMKGYLICKSCPLYHQYGCHEGLYYRGVYGSVRPKPKNEYICCCKIVHKNINTLTKFVRNDIKKMCSQELPYNKSELYQLLVNNCLDRYHRVSDSEKIERHKSFFIKNGYRFGEDDIVLIIYDKGRYGLIEIN
uniref:Uncharacterized protein n=1 Tax=viral metagenome TaxID=1070528 RepID=A0A6C0E8J0_9ZZZZ